MNRCASGWQSIVEMTLELERTQLQPLVDDDFEQIKKRTISDMESALKMGLKRMEQRAGKIEGRVG